MCTCERKNILRLTTCKYLGFELQWTDVITQLLAIGLMLLQTEFNPHATINNYQKLHAGHNGSYMHPSLLRKVILRVGFVRTLSHEVMLQRNVKLKKKPAIGCLIP